jgi:hypothetical protein
LSVPNFLQFIFLFSPAESAMVVVVAVAVEGAEAVEEAVAASEATIHIALERHSPIQDIIHARNHDRGAYDEYPASIFFSLCVLRYLAQTCGITPLGVFSDAFPGYKIWVYLLTAPGILVI